MRKILVVCVVSLSSLIAGCLPGETIIPVVHTLSPPAWIHGSWSDEYDISTYVFSGSTVLFVTQQVTLDMGYYYRIGTEQNESVSETVYEFGYELEGSFAVYHFELVNGGLAYTMTVPGVSVGPVTLYRQP